MLLTSPPSNKVLCSQPTPHPHPAKFISADGQQHLFAETPWVHESPECCLSSFQPLFIRPTVLPSATLGLPVHWRGGAGRALPHDALKH